MSGRAVEIRIHAQSDSLRRVKGNVEGLAWIVKITLTHHPLTKNKWKSSKRKFKNKPCLFPETINLIDSEKAGLLTYPDHRAFPVLFGSQWQLR